MGSIIYSVEDDVDIARIINKTLTKQGYQVYSFQDGKSFIEAFNKQKPDLVLLDLMLPDMNGNDIIKFIRIDIENNEVEIQIRKSGEAITCAIDSVATKVTELLQDL